MRKLSILFITAWLLIFEQANAQTVKTVGNTGSADYTTLSQAVNYINELTEIPPGGVIINVTAGQVFTENPPAITKVASASNPIVFQRSGEGANPIISYEDDLDDKLVVHIQNSAHITWNGIDVQDTNPTNANTYQVAVAIEASSDISIMNSTLTNFSRYGVYSAGASSNIHI